MSDLSEAHVTRSADGTAITSFLIENGSLDLIWIEPGGSVEILWDDPGFSPAEVLVSEGVKTAVTGFGIAFAEHGRYELKGLPGSWQLYRVVGTRAVD